MNLHSRWSSTRWDCQPAGKYCSYETPCCRRDSARHLSYWRGVSQGTDDTQNDHTAAVWVEADPGCTSPGKWGIPAPPEPNLDLKMLVWPWCLQGRREVMYVLSPKTKQKKKKKQHICYWPKLWKGLFCRLLIMCIKNASAHGPLLFPHSYILKDFCGQRLNAFHLIGGDMQI